ncbi:MAG: hypothetical protein ACMUEL_04120 [Flavobacteriales bacterium Tduv]
MHPKESSYLHSGGSEGEGKSKSVKKSKDKKRDSIRSRHSKKWLKKSGEIYYGYKKHIEVDKNGMRLAALHSVAANEA